MGGATRCLSSTEYMSLRGSRKAPNLSIVSTWVDLILQTGGRFAPRKPLFGRRAHPPLLLAGERRKWARGNQAMQIVSSEMMSMALSFSAPLFGPTKSAQRWQGVWGTHTGPWLTWHFGHVSGWRKDGWEPFCGRYQFQCSQDSQPVPPKGPHHPWSWCRCGGVGPWSHQVKPATCLQGWRMGFIKDLVL